MKLTRRQFLTTSAAAVAGAAACASALLRPGAPRAFSGGIVGGNAALGHAMRDGKFPAVSESAETGIVIVGGGIGGLAAARRLHRQGCRDFQLLELESRAGGNAMSGQNEISAYPWGAHYVPLAGSDAADITALFEDLGVITGRAASGLPIYNEEYLCSDPMERLYAHGRWQEGFVPQLGVAVADQRVIEAFFAEMHRLQGALGRDGRRAFTIPLDASSRDGEFTRLDQITMADYLSAQGWLGCAPLRWYVNYCCRDDYGAGIDQVSAWAGVHYFTSRDGRAANASSYAVVTWPEGNGWFVRQMQSNIQSSIRSSCAVWNVEAAGDHVLVDAYDAARGKSVRWRARGLVWAAPQFIARRALRSWREDEPPGPAPVYSPWVVANLTLDNMPAGVGMDLAWDNVLYDGDSLGYVVATHQSVERVPLRTVLTYYRPLDADEPAVARQKALKRSYADWCDMIVRDLAPAHPDLAAHITHLDVWLWGHAMIRPTPGYIWSAARARRQEPQGRIAFAHSDASGIAIFEEAYTRGVRAADHVLQFI